jgi:hypothetical protein
MSRVLLTMLSIRALPAEVNNLQNPIVFHSY